MTTWLWRDLHELFDTDDGSLPEIRVHYVDVNATIAGYSLLRARAARVVTNDAYYWSKTHDAARSLDSVPNAAALVVAGEAEPFHVVIGGIQSDGNSIPDLGVFVFPDELALDYRMGSAWGANELEVFFELLADLINLDPQSSLSLEEFVLPEVATQFKRAYERWTTERRLTNG